MITDNNKKVKKNELDENIDILPTCNNFYKRPYFCNNNNQSSSSIINSYESEKENKNNKLIKFIDCGLVFQTKEKMNIHHYNIHDKGKIKKQKKN